ARRWMPGSRRAGEIGSYARCHRTRARGLEWRRAEATITGIRGMGTHLMSIDAIPCSMEIGLHVSNFTFPGGASKLREDLVRIAATAEEQGFARLSVMDHVWQIQMIGPPEHEMLEAYTTLGFLAGRTERIGLLAWVSAVVYREPGLLAKAVTTLDVLSGGRAWLGIGAAWNEAEARGLGLPFPPTSERFERLEEALQICLQMWS